MHATPDTAPSDEEHSEDDSPSLPPPGPGAARACCRHRSATATSSIEATDAHSAAGAVHAAIAMDTFSFADPPWASADTFPAASAPGIAESLHTSSTAEPSPTAHPLLTLAASTSEELMASAPEWAAPDPAMNYTTPSHPSLDLLFPPVETDPAAQDTHNPHLSLPVWPLASLYPSAYASPYAIHPTRASPPPAAAMPASPVLLSMSFEESDSPDSALETPAISPSHGPSAPSPPSPPAVAAPCILAAPAHSVVLTTTYIVPSTLHAPPTPTDTHSTIDYIDTAASSSISGSAEGCVLAERIANRLGRVDHWPNCVVFCCLLLF